MPNLALLVSPFRPVPAPRPSIPLLTSTTAVLSVTSVLHHSRMVSDPSARTRSVNPRAANPVTLSITEVRPAET